MKSSRSNAGNAASSEYRLGLIYATLDSGIQNYKIAYDWYHQSAKRGDLRPIHQLSFYNFQGQGTPQNSKQGVYWLKQAALKKDMKAIKKIG